MVQHSVEEVDGFGGGEAAANIQRFVDEDGKGGYLEGRQLAHGHAQQVAVHGGHAFLMVCQRL